MTFLKILQIIGVIGTILTGFVSLVAPQSVQGFTGLTASGGRGITEIRAVLGAFPLITKSPVTYLMLGVAYLGIGFVRAVSMFTDKSVIQSNIISLVVEIIFGIILVIPI